MKKLDTLLVQIAIAIFPLFFLPITRDFFDYNKNILLFLFAFLTLVIYAVKSIRTKTLLIKVSMLDKAVFLFAGAYVVSFLFSNTNKVEAMLQPGGAGTIIALTILYFMVRQITQFREKSIFLTPMLVSGVILTLYMVVQMTGVLTKLPIPALFQIQTITPAGSLLVTAIYLGVVALVAAQEVFFTNQEQKKNMIIKGSLFIVVLLGFLLSVYNLMQEVNKPALLSHFASWSIAARAYETPQVAMIGVGPNNYMNAFTTGRPASLNQSEVWNIRFNTASNYFLHVGTEIGILGLIALLYLTYVIIKHREYTLGALAVLASMLLFPHSIVTLFLLFLFLAYIAAQKTKTYQYPAKDTHEKDALASALDIENSEKISPFVAIGVGAFITLLVVISTYFVARAYAAEYTMTKGIQSIATPNNQETYDLQLAAIQTTTEDGSLVHTSNPYMSEYRIIFSRTNLALANLIAGKEGLTDADRQTITQLVSQAVDNGKLAIQLRPTAITWENLAILYTNLIGAAQGADSWTVQSYAQAIALDPTNPLLRLSLGQVFYSLQLFDQAERQFEIAVNLKPDHANSWYNLANAQRQLGKTELARNSYTQALAILKEGTSDYDRALEELNALPASPAETAPGQLPELQELQGPEASKEADLNENVELNQDEAAPNVTLSEEQQTEATESGGFLIDELQNQNQEEPTPTP